jgi:hypothetical protein
MIDARRVRIGAGVLLLFAIVCYAHGFSTAAWFIACAVTGYLNAFHVIRPLVRLGIGKHIERRGNVLPSVLALAASIVIVVAGFWAVLVLATVLFVVIDAVVLRFR